MSTDLYAVCASVMVQVVTLVRAASADEAIKLAEARSVDLRDEGYSSLVAWILSGEKPSAPDAITAEKL